MHYNIYKVNSFGLELDSSKVSIGNLFTFKSQIKINILIKFRFILALLSNLIIKIKAYLDNIHKHIRQINDIIFINLI